MGSTDGYAGTASGSADADPVEAPASGSAGATAGSPGAEPVEAPNHIIIEGDNLHALTALTFTHEGKIDVIYIDPPYNRKQGF